MSENKIYSKGENADINKSIKFRLNKIEIDKSEVLTEKEISEIINKYEGKEILIKDLYKIVSEINSLYEEKGFIVCKAILPEQTIKKGIVKIEKVYEKYSCKYNIDCLKKYIRRCI